MREPQRLSARHVVGLDPGAAPLIAGTCAPGSARDVGSIGEAFEPFSAVLLHHSRECWNEDYC